MFTPWLNKKWIKTQKGRAINTTEWASIYIKINVFNIGIAELKVQILFCEWSNIPFALINYNPFESSKNTSFPLRFPPLTPSPYSLDEPLKKDPL